MKNIVIAEDDKALLPMITYNLEKSGFNVRSALTGEETLLLIKEEKPDLLLLDWMMPNLSGIEVCKQIRASKTTKKLPIIILTAKGEDEDKVMGLESGADDYIVKPFSPSELTARIKALIRRSSLSSINDQIISFGDLELDKDQYRVTRNGVNVHLGPTEFKLLKHFMENPGRVYSREQLLDSVWGHGIFVELRTVDTHIRRLRKAINLNSSKNLIRTVRAAGYSLDNN